MSIRVYAKPGCQPCKATKRKLDILGLEYDLIDVTESETARNAVESLGYQGVPVVVVDPETHWFGYSPDKIDALKG